MRHELWSTRQRRRAHRLATAMLLLTMAFVLVIDTKSPWLWIVPAAALVALVAHALWRKRQRLERAP